MKTELVFHWMSPDVITVTPDTPLAEAKTVMNEYKIRRLPVVDNEDKLVGIVTLGDIRKASASNTTLLGVWELNHLLARSKINMVMTPKPVTVYTTTPIVEAAQILLEHKVGGLPVVDPANGALMGIITEADIFRLVVQTWGKTKTRVLDSGVK